MNQYSKAILFFLSWVTMVGL